MNRTTARTHKAIDAVEERSRIKELIKDKIGSEGVLDIGKGASEILGVSHSQMVKAILDLMDENLYRPFYVPLSQSENPDLIRTVKVLSLKTYSYQTVMNLRDKIHHFDEDDRNRLHNWEADSKPHIHKLYKYGSPDVAVDGPQQRYRCRECGGNTFTLKPGDRVIVLDTMLFNNRLGVIEEVGPGEGYWDFNIELDPAGPDDNPRTSIGVHSFQISPVEGEYNGE